LPKRGDASCSLLLLVEVIDFASNIFKRGFSLLGLVSQYGIGSIIEVAKGVLITVIALSISEGSAEDVSVLLLWEVLVIVSVRMWVFSWVISIILPGGITSQVLWMSIRPALNIQISNRSALVVVSNSHSSLIGLVVDGGSSEEPLSLLTEGFEDMVWANFHD
jgi:hypothetical protein